MSCVEVLQRGYSGDGSDLGIQKAQPTRGGAVTEVWQTLCKLCLPLPPPAMGTRLPAMWTRWMADNAPHKSGWCRD